MQEAHSGARCVPAIGLTALRLGYRRPSQSGGSFAKITRDDVGEKACRSQIQNTP
jgi:hypothetical protein